jgi:hypothetical protein
MKRIHIPDAYTLHLDHMVFVIRQLFKRRNREDYEVYGIHTEDEDGNFLHLLCSKRRPSSELDDQRSRTK